MEMLSSDTDIHGFYVWGLDWVYQLNFIFILVGPEATHYSLEITKIELLQSRLITNLQMHMTQNYVLLRRDVTRRQLP